MKLTPAAIKILVFSLLFLITGCIQRELNSTKINEKYVELKGGYTSYDSHYKLKFLIDSIIPQCKYLKLDDSILIKTNFPTFGWPIAKVFSNDSMLSFKVELKDKTLDDNNFIKSKICINGNIIIYEYICAISYDTLKTIKNIYYEIAKYRHDQNIKHTDGSSQDIFILIWKSNKNELNYTFFENSLGYMFELEKYKKSIIEDSVKLHPELKNLYLNRPKYKVKFYSE